MRNKIYIKLDTTKEINFRLGFGVIDNLIENGEFIEGDEIYYYKTGKLSWKLLCGREGFLIKRNGKIIKNQIITMN